MNCFNKSRNYTSVPSQRYPFEYIRKKERNKGKETEERTTRPNHVHHYVDRHDPQTGKRLVKGTAIETILGPFRRINGDVRTLLLYVLRYFLNQCLVLSLTFRIRRLFIERVLNTLWRPYTCIDM